MKKKILRYLSLTIVPFFIHLIMRILWVSYRKEYTLISQLPQTNSISLCWHGELFISPQVYRKFYPKSQTYAIISQHLDGEIISKVLNKFNILSTRGSSSKRAVGVLIEALKLSKKNNSILITPDGPRGPRYSFSDGAIILAQKNNLPLFVVNFKVKNNHFWQFRSWDRFVIPKPFSKLIITMHTFDAQNLSLDEAKEQLSSQMRQFSI